MYFLRQLRLGEGKKKDRKKKKPQGKNIMVCPITKGDHKNVDVTFVKQTISSVTTCNYVDIINEQFHVQSQQLHNPSLYNSMQRCVKSITANNM